MLHLFYYLTYVDEPVLSSHFTTFINEKEASNTYLRFQRIDLLPSYQPGSKEERKERVKDKKGTWNRQSAGPINFLISLLPTLPYIHLGFLLRVWQRRKDRTKRRHLAVKQVSIRTTVKQQIMLTLVTFSSKKTFFSM